DSHAGDRICMQVGIVPKNGHAQGAGKASHLATDTSEPDQPQDAAVYFDATMRLKIVLALAFRESTLDTLDVLCQGQKQRKRVLGRRTRGTVGHVADHD